MFYYISGTLVHKDINFVVIDAGGVGYKLFASEKTIGKLLLNEPCKMLTYSNIREDAFDIFGFWDREELSAFEMLIAINGVGPKAGLAILSCFSPSELFSVIAAGDYKPLTKAPGIGAKVSQRIVLELKDKLKGTAIPLETTVRPENRTLKDNAVSALLTLGYSSNDAQKAVGAVVKEDSKLEDVIREALKQMM